MGSKAAVRLHVKHTSVTELHDCSNDHNNFIEQVCTFVQFTGHRLVRCMWLLTVCCARTEAHKPNNQTIEWCKLQKQNQLAFQY